MLIRYAKESFFYPDWNGNLDQPENQRIKVNYHHISAEEHSKYVYRETMVVKSTEVEKMNEADETKQKAEASFKLHNDTKGKALAMVDSIENLEIQNDKGGDIIKIKTLRDLYDAEGGWGAEILAAKIESYLSEEGKTQKKS